MSAALVTPVASGLTFEPEGHRYYQNGEQVVGVTRSLQIAGIIDYSGIPQAILDRAAERGRNVHTCFEYFDRGTLDPSTVDGEIGGHLKGYQSFLADTSFVPASIEVRRFHGMRKYAGTFDRTGFFDTQSDVFVILDFKSGEFQEGHFVQVTGGYANLFPQPRRFRVIVLQTKANGTYKIHESKQANFEYYTSLMFSAVACAQFSLKEGRY